MPWWKFWEGQGKTSARPGRPPGASGSADTGTVVIRDAERRRLRRLLQRRSDLDYDLARARSAFEADNPWTERIDQLDAAVAQGEADLEALKTVRREEPSFTFPPDPIEVVEVNQADPATVVLRARDLTLRYQEEVDWAERGHQLALPELRRTEGDVAPLIPAGTDPDLRARLTEHLRHSFSIIADDALQRAVDGEPAPAVTLADITRPCPECGGWLDPKGRCPACVELDWKRQQVRADIERLRKERDEVLQDLERFRERLPVIQRQLAETDADIAQLRAKGVEPS